MFHICQSFLLKEEFVNFAIYNECALYAAVNDANSQGYCYIEHKKSGKLSH